MDKIIIFIFQLYQMQLLQNMNISNTNNDVNRIKHKIFEAIINVKVFRASMIKKVDSFYYQKIEK